MTCSASCALCATSPSSSAALSSPTLTFHFWTSAASASSRSEIHSTVACRQREFNRDVLSGAEAA